MPAAKTKKSVIKVFESASKNVRDYFPHLQSLIENYPLDVALSYVFSQVELAHNMTLYCGAVKLHRCETSLARAAVNTHHMTRKGFKEKFSVVIGKQIPEKISKGLENAEEVRDQVMHGKNPTVARMRDAVADVIKYADSLNEFVFECGGFRPFGALKGFKGRAKPLDKSTTRWVLKGMGFELG